MHGADLARELIKVINKCTLPLVFMEVCGTHTMAVSRYGLRSMLPDNIRLLSGPGCPVCVTTIKDIDIGIAFARIPSLIFTTFGDMLRVPGSHSSLLKERADGRDVRVVCSILEALQIAKNNPFRPVVFFGVGFETTVPGVALGIMEARKADLKNFSVFCVHKTLPKVLRTLLDAETPGINGFILPGHVSAIIGARAYDFLTEEYAVGGVVAGFEPNDILNAILRLIRQKESRPMIENAYRRVVKDNGNQAAINAMEQVFSPCDSEWRGIGVIPRSGLSINAGWQEYDALERYTVDKGDAVEQNGCACGEILRGIKLPRECALFGTICVPEKPVGPCMVSGEGACAAYYRYH